MCLLTKIKAQSRVPLEEGAVGFGLDVGSFLHQHLHMLKTPPFNGNMEGRLTCDVTDQLSNTELHQPG